MGYSVLPPTRCLDNLGGLSGVSHDSLDRRALPGQRADRRACSLAPAPGFILALFDTGERRGNAYASGIYAPLAGEVTAINDGLAADPAQINSDPMGKGWFFKLRPSNLKAEIMCRGPGLTVKPATVIARAGPLRLIQIKKRRGRRCD